MNMNKFISRSPLIILNYILVLKQRNLDLYAIGVLINFLLNMLIYE